jgi:hypothetical protein
MLPKNIQPGTLGQKEKNKKSFKPQAPSSKLQAALTMDHG